MPKQRLPGSLKATSDASCSSPISRAATLNSDTAMWRARAEQEDAVLQIGLYHHIPSPGSCLALVASGLRSVHLVGDSRMRGLAVSLRLAQLEGGERGRNQIALRYACALPDAL